MPAGVGIEADYRLDGLRGDVLGRGEYDVKDVRFSGLHHLGDPLLVGPSAVSSAHAGILPREAVENKKRRSV
jgi:hypothetical protein